MGTLSFLPQKPRRVLTSKKLKFYGRNLRHPHDPLALTSTTMFEWLNGDLGTHLLAYVGKGLKTLGRNTHTN